MARRDVDAQESLHIHAKISNPQVFLLRMAIFLILVGFVAAILFNQFATAFVANPALNGLILGVLVVGIAYAFRQIGRLFPEIRWVNHLQLNETGLAAPRQPTLLAPMANMLRDRRGQLTLSPAAMRTILDSTGARLDEARETSRYLVGLLIFLGLLGTFWGLLATIDSVGRTISSLDVSGGDSLTVFQDLKTGLEAPLAGMGTAFSSSLFGLSGSLVLGFLDLQANHAQNRFYNELEEWLSAATDLSTGTAIAGANPQDAGAAQLRFALIDMQRSLNDLGERIQLGMQRDDSGEAVKELARGIEKLVRQMRAEQKVVREWVDEQAAQQNELAAVLRELTGSMERRS